MANIGSLSVTLRAITEPFTRAINAARRALDEFSKHVAGVSTQMSGFAVPLKMVATSLASLSFTKLVSDSLTIADALGEAAQRIGIAASELLQLREVAEMTGVEMLQLDASLQNMTVTIAKRETGTAAAFARMGLNMRQLSRMDPAQQLEKIADAMARMRTEGERTAAAMMIFGRAGANMTLMLGDGGRTLRDRMGQMGAGPSAADIAVADAAADMRTRAGQLIQRTGLYLATRASQFVVENVETMQGRINAVRGGVNAVRGFLGLSGGGNQGNTIGLAGRAADNAFNRLFLGAVTGTPGQLGRAGLNAIGSGMSGLRGLRNRLAGMAFGFGLTPGVPAGPQLPTSGGMDALLGPLRAVMAGRGMLQRAGGLLGRGSNALGALLAGRADFAATGSIGAVDARSREGFAQRTRAMRDDPLVKVQQAALRELKGINRNTRENQGEAANF